MPLLIGKRNEPADQRFPLDGRIDEVAIWNRALPNAEIALLYNGGTGAPVLPAAGELAGDNNNNGFIEQGDLDLVLLNWGSLAVPVDWVHDLPVGHVDQEELDKVLLGWGNTTPVTAATAAVPEPATWGMLLLSTFAAVAALARVKGRGP